MLKQFQAAMSKMVFGILLAMALTVAIFAANTQTEPSSVLVRTRQGLIEGLTVGHVEQFRGVPYAAPPLADLRWRAPLPPKPYSGTLHATTFPAPCMQGRALTGFSPVQARTACTSTCTGLPGAGKVRKCRYSFIFTAAASPAILRVPATESSLQRGTT